MPPIVPKPILLPIRYPLPPERRKIYTPPKKGDRNMTVCIAAICHGSSQIVAACDMKISTGIVSADAITLKMAELNPHWCALWSSNDVLRVRPILSRARESLLGQANDLVTVSSALAKAYQEELRSQINNRILARFGLDVSTFLSTGLACLGTEAFNEVFREIKAIKLDSSFLAFGFDKTGKPHIFTVCEPGDIQFYDPIGFAAIGSGGYSAENMLYFHQMNVRAPMVQAIYCVCEAKFMAESASDVGKETFLLVMDKTGNVNVFHHTQIPKIRRLWEKQGRAKIPPKATHLIGELYAEAELINMKISEAMNAKKTAS